ncbi:hypothetical protein HYV31_01495 [candidate division WWE3 bacterium]|nr:hypothetical protein [candidate division WWE3 bacterium]
MYRVEIVKIGTYYYLMVCGSETYLQVSLTSGIAIFGGFDNAWQFSSIDELDRIAAGRGLYIVNIADFQMG